MGDRGRLSNRRVALVPWLFGDASASGCIPIGAETVLYPVGIEADRIGCPVGTDGRPMGQFAQWARASSGSIGVSHETGVTDGL